MQTAKSKKAYPFANPVVETYRGVSVRRYNKIQIRVNPFEYKKFIDARIDDGYSDKEAIEHKRILFPCHQKIISPQPNKYAKIN